MDANAEAHLTVEVKQDHDGECRITATLKSGSYSGSGEAWLSAENVLEFASSVSGLARTGRGEAKLVGGFVSSDGSPDPTVNLLLKPHGLRGHIAIRADLSSGPRTGQIVHRMSAALVTEPAGLERFAHELTQIGPGTAITATVAGEDAA